MNAGQLADNRKISTLLTIEAVHWTASLYEVTINMSIDKKSVIRVIVQAAKNYEVHLRDKNFF